MMICSVSRFIKSVARKLFPVCRKIVSPRPFSCKAKGGNRGFYDIKLPLYIVKFPVGQECKVEVSQIMENSQIGLFTTLEIIILGWVVLLMILALKEMNDYSMGKTVGMILLSLFTMVMIWSMAILLYTIASQFVGMIKEIFYEVIYRID